MDIDTNAAASAVELLQGISNPSEQDLTNLGIYKFKNSIFTGVCRSRFIWVHGSRYKGIK